MLNVCMYVTLPPRWEELHTGAALLLVVLLLPPQPHAGEPQE
jgi:hypothetical protein